MRNKDIAGLLGFTLGTWGVHQFYLGKYFKGFMHLFFFYYIGWKFSLFFAILSSIKLLFMSEETFDLKFNNGVFGKFQRKNTHPNIYQNSSRSLTQNTNQNPIKNTSQKEYAEIKNYATQKFNSFDFEGAITNYNKMLQLNDKELETYFQLACCYSASEHKELGFYYLSKSVEMGLKDFNKIANTDSLAYLRIQPEYTTFVQNGYKLIEIDTNILERIKDFKAGVLDEDGLVLTTKKSTL
jgi:TM2 domain-containing membrane protein YozV